MRVKKTVGPMLRGMQAYTHAKTELSQLRDFYESACYAFTQTEAVLRWKGPRKIADIETDLVVVDPIIFSLKRGNRVRQQLRELIFIRLISVLEAYLVDNVRNVFFLTKAPFKEQELQVSFTQAEILSAESMSYVFSKIINKECRGLTSGGYSEIVKYYKKRFELDLAAISPGKSAMAEYHERRHIFVHRLGKPDDSYRKTNAYLGNRLQVDEPYLLTCFADLEGFVDTVHGYLTQWLESVTSQKAKTSQPSSQYKIILPKDRQDEPTLFNDDFHFWVGDEIYAFRDIVKKKTFLNDREFELVVAGNQQVIISYDKHLRRAEKKGHFIASRRTLSILRPVKLDISPELIAKIQQSLPAQPWPTGVHKTVAGELGLHDKVVSAAIKMLIARHVFKHQVNGKIVDGDWTGKKSSPGR